MFVLKFGKKCCLLLQGDYLIQEILNYSPVANSVTLKTASARLSEMSQQYHDHTQPNDPEFDQHPTRKPEILQLVYRFYFLTPTSALRMKYTLNIHVKV
jgi:hypothetical protein